MMKFKPNQTRTYDREGFKKRAACLCFRSEREDENERRIAQNLENDEAVTWWLEKRCMAMQRTIVRRDLDHAGAASDVLLVSSSRYPDQWIVPGGGMEPEEEPGGAAVREVYEEAGVKGKLGRLLGIFELISLASLGRKREWFKVEDAIKVLQCHKPVHAEYLEKLKLGCSPTNGNSVVSSHPDNNSLYVSSAQTSGLPSTVR
ncbi:Diphosphoinositol polyphosphate phosphohydrolase 2 [Varanus komodoensis]|nr:Diphosphoinositol polyphosphate phosphohydrolase 2 [Varanus komodoensis]